MPTDIVLLLGLGLVGQSIQSFLISRKFSVSHKAQVVWTDGRAVAGALKQAGEHLIGLCDPIDPPDIHLIWAAGKGGFGSQNEGFQDEMFAFKTLLFLARELSGYFPQKIAVHLISSAGGLFEGQTCVDEFSKPNPLRPYGRIKLEQEQKVQDLPEDIARQIYRLSSVYGYNGAKGRAGLVVALVQKGLQGVPVHIYGKSDTLRDFVFVDDVGDFIAGKIASGNREYAVYFLTGGKPTSMYEMIKTVQNILKKRLFFRYITGGDNTSHISYSRRSFPQGWAPTIAAIGLAKTVQKIHQDML